MTSIEKKMLAVLIIMIAGVVVSIYYTAGLIEDAGGIKAVIIEAGKEVKDISNQISED